MKRNTDARAGLLAGLTAGTVQAETDKRMADAADRGKMVALVPASLIRPRHGIALRSGRPGHVLALAENIAALGLLSPITLDAQNRLVAGQHRLDAIKLLLSAEAPGWLTEGLDAGERERLAALPPMAELPEPLRAGMVPARIMIGLDSTVDAATAMAIEAAENTARQQYSPAEVRNLAARLRSAGFRDADGRPKKGEKALKPALAVVLGVDVSTVRRILNQPKKPTPQSELEKPAQVSGFPHHAVLRLCRALAYFTELKPTNKADADVVRAAIVLTEKINNLS